LDFPVNRFPYISYMDIINKVEFESKDYSIEKFILPFNRKSLSFFSGTLKPFGKGSIGILPNVLWNKNLLLGLIRNGYHLKFLDVFKVGVDHLGLQLKIVSETIAKIFIDLSIKNTPEPVIELIKKHILVRVIESEDIKIDCDVIITGGMGELWNCCYGAIARVLNRPIINIVHGAGDQLLFDEPFFGYGDRTNSSILFGFGPKPLKGVKDDKYLKSLYGQPEYITSNSNFIKRIYNNNNILPIKNHAKMKWMYVPDSLMHHKRYGPFSGNIPSKLYLQWQTTLMSNFDSILYKRHPKGHSIFRELSNNDLKNLILPHSRDIPFITDNFYDIYDQCDGYIFDHISTGFMVASATNKPIIYFNIGKRNLTDYAEKIVKERCLWIDVDPANPSNLRDKVESMKKKTFTNDVTPEFSLDNSNQDLTREQKLLKTIKSIV